MKLFKKIIYLLENLSEEKMCEMANLRQQSTGLPMIIYVSEKVTMRHGPRIKVQSNHATNLQKENLVTVTISDSPELFGNLDNKDFNLVKKFIALNKDILIQYWETEIDTSEFIKKLKKI